MRMGSIIGAMVAASASLGLVAAPDFPDLLDVPVFSSSGGLGMRPRSPGARARRRWKRTRASGITKRVRP